jgi:hypothetical protein
MDERTFHPLGLPKGSVRALLALSCFFTVMALLMLEKLHQVKLFWELWLANYVMLGYYFASRQNQTAQTETAEEPSPLHLPKGTVRWLIILGFLGTAIFILYQWSQGKRALWEHHAFFPIVSLASFFFGRVFQAVTGSWNKGASNHWKLLLNAKALAGLFAAITIPVTLLFDVDFPYILQLQRFSLVYIVFYFGSR